MCGLLFLNNKRGVGVGIKCLEFFYLDCYNLHITHIVFYTHNLHKKMKFPLEKNFFSHQFLFIRLHFTLHFANEFAMSEE